MQILLCIILQMMTDNNQKEEFRDKLQYLTYFFLFITMTFKLTMIFKRLHVWMHSSTHCNDLFLFLLNFLLKWASFRNYFINFHKCDRNSIVAVRSAWGNSNLIMLIFSSCVFCSSWCFPIVHSSPSPSSAWSPSISRAAYLLAELNFCNDI